MLKSFLFNAFYPKGQYFEHFNQSKVGIFICFPLDTFRQQFVLDYLDLLEPFVVFNEFEIKHKVSGTKSRTLQQDFLQRYSKVYDEINEPKYWERVEFLSKKNISIEFYYPFHRDQPPNVVFLQMPLMDYNVLENSSVWQSILQYDFISLYVFNLNYFYNQGSLNIFSVEADGIPSSYYTYMTNDTNDHVVDISQNAGKSVVITNTWLMASWKMCFGNKFYDLVSKEKLLNFTNAESIKEIEDGKVFIDLYKEFNEPHFRKNREKQLIFLKCIQYDLLVKKDRE